MHRFLSPKGGPEDDFDGYRSRFGFAWWFWLPKIHLQHPEVLNRYSNPRVIRLIWLCCAIGVDIGYDGFIGD